MRLTRRGHKICSESTERNIQHKKMGLSGDEGNKDPIYPRLSFSQLPWEIRGGGMMTQRRRIRSPTVCSESLYVILPSSPVAGSHSGCFNPINPRGESILKVIPEHKFGCFFHNLCKSRSLQCTVGAGEGKTQLYLARVPKGTTLLSCKQIIFPC